MRRTLVALTLGMTLVMLFSFSAAALGLKFETGQTGYQAAGLEAEFDLPFVPLAGFVDVLGWYDGSAGNFLQLGAGARLLIWNGFFVEGKYRLFYEYLGGTTVHESSLFTAGIGYRFKSLVNFHVVAQTRLQDHDTIPQYFLGVRLGF